MPGWRRKPSSSPSMMLPRRLPTRCCAATPMYSGMPRSPPAAQSEAWEEHKAAERQPRARQAGMPESVLDGVALALPALLRAAKIQRRAARIGFDWPDPRPVMEKVLEEVAELKTESEMG